MNNLSSLAIESDECRDLMRSIAFGPFLNQVRRKPMGISFSTQRWKDHDLFFWKIVLRETLHSVGLGMFSEKSVISFLERVRVPVAREGWLQCRKDYAVYLKDDGQVYVLFPKSFPWGKPDRVVLHPMSLPVAQSLSMGPWRISTCVQAVSGDDEKEALLTRKAVPDMDSFMDGYIQYYVEARAWTTGIGNSDPANSFGPRPLVFDTFTKSTRPLAWKNTDTKLQEKLPLLGCDQLSLSALKDPIGCSAVHVDETGATRVNPVILIKITLEVIASEARPAKND
jgi:hypothetical protein